MNNINEEYDSLIKNPKDKTKNWEIFVNPDKNEIKNLRKAIQLETGEDNIRFLIYNGSIYVWSYVILHHILLKHLSIKINDKFGTAFIPIKKVFMGVGKALPNGQIEYVSCVQTINIKDKKEICGIYKPFFEKYFSNIPEEFY